ncbi:MAG: BatA and WFA domain-containing protein [Verrucomicrobiota bacterium]
MNFLWPLGWGLAALALPVIALYLIRQKTRLRPVSTLLFWQLQENRIHHMPFWRKLRRLISLLLQILFLLLLVAALSRPLWPGQDARQRSVIIVLDTGPTLAAGLGHASRWKKLQEQAEREIDQLRFLDEAMIIRSGEFPEILCTWTNRAKVLKQAVRRCTLSENFTNIRESLVLARNLVESRGNGKVVLLSDGVWPQVPGDRLMDDVELVLIHQEELNAGITLFSARRSPVVPGRFQLDLALAQNSDQEMSGQLSLFQGERLMDAIEVTIPVGQPWYKRWDMQGEEAQRFRAEFVPAQADAWAADDRAEAAIARLNPIRIGMVSDESSYVEAALRSIPMAEVQRMSVVPAAASSAREAIDLWVFNQHPVPEGFNGEAVILIRPEGQGKWGQWIGSIDRPVLSEVLVNRSMMRFVELYEVQLREAGQYQPADGAITYARALEYPLIFGNWERAPRWLVIGFRPNDSDLIFRTAFPILLSNLAELTREEASPGVRSPLGVVATELQPTVKPALQADGNTESLGGSWMFWKMWPLWAWALLAGLLWLLAEWFLFTRRITE